jgi:1-acyl-sn-glycerol-3-phosphate acyltransferase
LDWRSFWHRPLCHICKFLDYFGRIYHGYEMDGLNNIPDKGGALIIMYHGTSPIDIGFIGAQILLYKKRKPILVADRVIFHIPGVQTLMNSWESCVGSRDSLVDLLKKGELVLIYPGGVREQLFSTDMYDILWQHRNGFADVATKAKAVILI